MQTREKPRQPITCNLVSVCRGEVQQQPSRVTNKATKHKMSPSSRYERPIDDWESTTRIASLVHDDQDSFDLALHQKIS